MSSFGVCGKKMKKWKSKREKCKAKRRKILKGGKRGNLFLYASFGSHRKLWITFLWKKYDIFSPKWRGTGEKVWKGTSKKGEKREFIIYLLVMAWTGNYATPYWKKILYFWPKQQYLFICLIRKNWWITEMLEKGFKNFRWGTWVQCYTPFQEGTWVQ